MVSATLDASCCCGVKQFSGHVKVAQKFESTVQLVIELSFLQLPVKEERIWIIRVSSEFVFPLLRRDNGAPLHDVQFEKRTIASRIPPARSQ